jgi:sn-glycerol 3-phosphate transport system substrate-binding protein
LECPFITGVQSWIHLENLSAWHNEPVASQNNGLAGDRPELQFNTRLALRHISLLSAWRKSELFQYAGRGNSADEKFANGECAILTASSAAYADIARHAKFKLGVAQLPYYDDYPGAPFNTLVGGAALWVMAGKPPAEYRAVARFLEFLASPVVAAEWHQGTGYIPITRGAYLATKRTGYYDQHPDMEIAVKQLMGTRPGNLAKGVRIRHFADIRAIINEELDTVWSDKKAPKTALDEAVERGNALLRKSGPASAAPTATGARCRKGGCK